MKLLDSLAARLGYVKAHKQNYPDWLLATAGAMRWSVPEGRHFQTQATLYQKLTWLSTAVDIVAQFAASQAFNVKRRTGEDTEDIPNHEFELRLQAPNPLQDAEEFLFSAFAWYKVTGNCYLWLNRASETAPADELWVLPSHMVKPIPDGRLYLRGYEYNPGSGKPIMLEPWEVCHVKTFNPINPLIGLSAIESLAVVGMSDIAQQTYNLNLFGKDNAKIPGALAFADPIPDPDWIRLKEEAKQQWGGVERRGPMMLRKVGAGGVQWLTMAMSQKEMEFLESRTFTKEEGYGKLAPGLASMLAVNATEANAIAGKSTLMELAVWPLLTRFAGAFTNHLLPAYGEGLIGEFDDPRQANRILDLQEQEAYSKYHTIDEVRSEYYNEDPLGDERGALLVGEIGKTGGGAPMAGEPLETIPSEAAIRAELESWQRFAIKRLGKPGGREFEPRAVPLFQATRIRAQLEGVTTADVVRLIFAREMSGSEDVRALTEEIRLARLALEHT